MDIQLAKIKKEDIELIRKWRMSQEVTKYMLTDPVITKEQQRIWYRTICNTKNAYYWIIKCSDVRIGFISITNIDTHNSSCEIGHYIGEVSYRRKGISKIVEANIYDFIFQNLRLENVDFIMLKDNKGAYKLHQSLGAIKREIEVKECIKNNQSYELVALRMTNTIWQKHKENNWYPKIIIE